MWQKVNEHSYVVTPSLPPPGVVLPAGFYKPQMLDGMFGPQLLVNTLPRIVCDEAMLLTDSATEWVIAGIKKFWAAKARFERFGLIHKRGILLHGEPGSGKTVASYQVANWLVESSRGVVFFVDADEYSGASAAIKSVRQSEPERPMLIIMEDFDVMVSNSKDPEAILSLLDGNDQVGNIIFLATTNHLYNLDERFIKRPSRFDEVIYVGAPSAEARRVYLKTQLAKHGEKLDNGTLEKWVAESDGLMLSHLREMIVSVLVLERSLEETTKRLREMLPTQSSTTRTGGALFESLGGLRSVYANVTIPTSVPTPRRSR